MEALHDLIKAGRCGHWEPWPCMRLPVLQHADDSKAARLDAFSAMENRFNLILPGG